MIKLRKILPDSTKDIRHRHNLINIHIEVLGWLIEFSGAFVVILGSFILGHGSALVTLSLQTLTIIIYFIILPCVFLINIPDVKTRIASSNFYIRIIKFFNLQRKSENEGTDEDGEENTQGRTDDNDEFKVYPEFNVFE